METATQVIITNFLRTDQKKIDSRYATSESLSNKGLKNSKIIYWLAILDLKSVTKDQTEYPLSFITHHGELKEDREYFRDIDGAQKGGMSSTVLYNLKEVIPLLISAKECGSKYMHLFIKEVVQANGRLYAYILIDNEKSGAYKLSQSWLWSDEIWRELPTFKTFYLSYIDVSKLTEVLIRNTKAYNWQK